MGRRIPSDPNPLIHPAFSFSLLAAWIAATIAIISTLCGFRRRKLSSLFPSLSSLCRTTKKAHLVKTTTSGPSIPMLSSPTTTAAAATALLEDSTKKTTLLQKQSALTPTVKETTYSKRKLITSLSMRLPGRGGAMERYQGAKEEQRHQQQGRLKREDSIWTKTIILGERCRVPNEDDDDIIYDDKGNRISMYHPRTPRSLPVSRSNSLVYVP